MAGIEIRAATQEDRAAVLAFSRNTWEWGDYIEFVYDDWLHNSQGLLLVGAAGDRPVGIVHMQMLNATEAWLEGMRVDPAYRNQGIASMLNTAAIAEARQRGATTVRLMTDSTNTTSIYLAERGQMEQVGAFALYQAEPLTSVPVHNQQYDTPRQAALSDLDEIISYLDNSNLFPLVGGLYYRSFVAYRITDTLLKAQIQAGQIYLLRRWDRVDGLVIAEIQEGHAGKHLFLGYIDGTTADSLSFIAYYMRQLAHKLGIKEIRAAVPDLLLARDAFAGAEYTWQGRVFNTYEKELDANTQG